MARLSSILSDVPIRRRQYGIVALVMLCLVLDGLDIQLLSFVTPILLVEWSVERATFAPALTAAIVGMTVGSAGGGALGDRWGRKKLLVGSTLFFGAMTIAAGFAHDIPTLAACRFLSGLGFGAAAPNAFALATEWLPQRTRGRVVGLLGTGGPLGGAIGSAAAIGLLPVLGWRGCFIACGVVVLCVGVWMFLRLPESPAYLLVRGETARATALVRRVLRIDVDSVEPDTDTAMPSQAAQGSAHLFTRANLRINIGNPAVYFFVTFISYALIGWLPTILTLSGLSMAQALQGSLVQNILGLAGVLISPFVIERIGSRRLILLACLIWFGGIWMLASALAGGGAAITPLTYLQALVSIGAIGLAIGLAATAALLIATFGYPAACRAGGIGLTTMGARAGGIAGLMTGGFLLSLRGDDPTPLFIGLAVAVLGVAAAMTLIDRHVAARKHAGISA